MFSTKITRATLALSVFGIAALGFIGCGSNTGGEVRLQGAGATFPNPLYQKWLSEYGKLNANVKIDYQSIGSGGGIKQIQARTVDFGASEPLRFSPDVIADVFLGKITKWNDPRIKADNADASLPSAEITVVHRAEASGTSFVFSDYLSKVSADWKQKVGADKSPNWPVGQGGKGNEGVTGQIKQQPNTIGYVELAYAVQNKLPVALVKNASGVFVEPSVDAVTAAAAASAATTPDDLRVSITNANGAGVYPISSYTYILAYKAQSDATKGKTLVDFLWWGIHDGEQFARDLQYAPLPDEIIKRAEAKINSITAGGKPLR